MSIIQTQNLKKIFSKDKKIQFSDVSLADASVLFVQGPSGAGKTTFMKILAKLDTDFLGIYKTDLQKEEIGYFFHDYKLIQNLSVMENILLGNMHKHIETAGYKLGVEKLAKSLGVDKKLTTPVKKLSSGEYQRICLIRCFIGNKKCILLDEPTSHLDDTTSHLVHKLILEYYERGVVFIISSHDTGLFHFLERKLDTKNIFKITMQ